MFYNPELRKLGILLGATSLSISISNAQATMTSEASMGLFKTQKSTIHGTVSIITPAFVQAGDRISGTVIVDPKGDSEASRKANRSALQAMAIRVMGTVISADNPSFTLVVPRKPTKVVIGNDETPITVLPGDSLDSKVPSGNFRICRLGEPIQVMGNFDGDISNTRCKIGGQIGTVIAESPRQVIVLASTGTGPQDIEIQDNGTTSNAKINVVKIDLTVPKTQLLKGEKTELHVGVVGLTGLSKNDLPVRISVVNESPQNIRLGDKIQFEHHIQAKEISKTGEFKTNLPITATQPGGFSISGQVFYDARGTNNDEDRPIDMDGMDTVGDLRDYSTRRLMDTLRDLRYRKMWDYVQGKKSQEWLTKKIKLIKGALKQRGVEVDDKPIDDEDF